VPERRKLTFLYSGQGSHYYQMGRDLFEQRGPFYRHALELDDLLLSKPGTCQFPRNCPRPENGTAISSDRASAPAVLAHS
jgi:malonyl CoA-acyl carrier protein transacylase